LVFSGIFCCSSGPVVGWWARERSRAVVAEMVGVPIARACLDADGEGGRWYFAVTEPLSAADTSSLDLRLSRGERVQRRCRQPVYGPLNPTPGDAPGWFDWPGEGEAVMDRCHYAGPGYLTVTVVRADGTLLLLRDEDGVEQPGWPSGDELSFIGLFCD
jgi:hypothetical protein